MIIHKHILEDSEIFLKFLKNQRTILEKSLDTNKQEGKQSTSSAYTCSFYWV